MTLLTDQGWTLLYWERKKEVIVLALTEEAAKRAPRGFRVLIPPDWILRQWAGQAGDGTA